MDPFRKIPKKFTKKFGNKVINRQYFHRKTGLKNQYSLYTTMFILAGVDIPVEENCHLDLTECLS